jgi:hypothetical protein
LAEIEVFGALACRVHYLGAERSQTLRDLLPLLFEYRRLSALAEAFAGTLRPGAQRRLTALEKLFGEEPGSQKSSHPRRHARCEVSLPATIKINGNVQPVQVVNIGGGGVCVSPAPKLKAGESACLRIVSNDEHTVFQYQVEGGWSWRDDNESQMGLPFIGAPRELPKQRQRAGSAY